MRSGLVIKWDDIANVENSVKTELGYVTEPFRYDFEAEIGDRITLPDGRKGIVLPKTYFYPTGGGQEHDTGTLGDARVTDVTLDDAGTVVHIVDREVAGTRVPAKIDAKRRFAFMQHHSAQHLLSQAIERTLNLETISSRISIESPTTIDLPASTVDEKKLERAEELANAVIFEDRPIKSYLVPEDQISTVPLRRPPKVSGQIRIVEIEGFDYSACGGTHCTRTGMLGLVKIVKAERRGEETRIYFVAGERAFQCFREEHSIVTKLSQRLNANPQTVIEALERQFDLLRAAQDEVQQLKADKLVLEAKQLAASAEAVNSRKLVVASFRNRPVQELRAMAAILQNEPRLASLLTTYDGAKIGLTVTCAKETGLNANQIIRTLLAPMGGRGGGDARLAQGGGAIEESQLDGWLARARGHLREVLNTMK